LSPAHKQRRRGQTLSQRVRVVAEAEGAEEALDVAQGLGGGTDLIGIRARRGKRCRRRGAEAADRGGERPGDRGLETDGLDLEGVCSWRRLGDDLGALFLDRTGDRRSLLDQRRLVGLLRVAYSAGRHRYSVDLRWLVCQSGGSRTPDPDIARYPVRAVW
jgi:hypothetical protein